MPRRFPIVRHSLIGLAAVLASACSGDARLAGDRTPRDPPGQDAVELVLPVAAADRDEWLRPYVGRLVRIPGELTVADLYGLERHGEVLLHAGGRAMQFTNRHIPDRAGYAAHERQFELGTIVLDDGATDDWVRPVRFFRATRVDGSLRPIRVGDRVTGLTGILDYRPASADGGDPDYRLVPSASPEFRRMAPEPPLEMPADDVLRVMAANALNLFATPRTGDNRCGPNRLQCRGADSTAEFDRQVAKLAATIAQSGAGIVGLMEVENDDGRTLGALARAVGNITGGTWRHVRTGVIGGDAIRVALLFDAAHAQPVGEHRILTADVDPDFIDDRNRPSLAQTFRTDAGDTITVVVNHLKSKGSDCNDLGDPDTGDGQGNCSLTRTRAATALARWLANDPTGSRDADVLIIGDLNAYPREDPVRALEDAGYINLVTRFEDAGAYTYVFGGRSGVLDYALASPELAEKIASTAIWHVNADEARLRDYNLDNGRDPALFEPGLPYRSSDHDPVIVDIRTVH